MAEGGSIALNRVGGAAAQAANGEIPQMAKQVDELGENVRALFLEFLQSFELNIESSARGEDGSSYKEYVYLANEMKEKERTTLYVDYAHVAVHRPELAEAIVNHYYRLEPFLASAVQTFLREVVPTHPYHKPDGSSVDNPFHVSFHNLPLISTIRDLKTSRIGQLMAISGTITRTSQVRPELTLATFRCQDCRSEVKHVQQQFKYTEPTLCSNSVCTNHSRWELDLTRSTFADWQLVRVQENANEIPAGSMPRSIKVVLRHEIVELAKPGDKVIFTGVLSVIPDVSQLSGTNRGAKLTRSTEKRGSSDYNNGVTGLKELGVRDLTYSLCFVASAVKTSTSAFGSVTQQVFTDVDGMMVPEQDIPETFSSDELAKITEMRNTSKLYARLVNSIAPNIFGHEEIKRGILLMLLGGVHKKTSDGQNLRGDINVCIVGDPSTSKSQFLKYVCAFLPRAVYTSGKASSAAGLTASVAKDPETGEFAIEAGALMLADNGICCIDEFDKMDPADQVAIHEAMEQQTISISKAGIQATLNARTSILAAANPIKGRYDTARTLKQNVDISAPIMSRFDLFFVVLDEGDQAIDYNIARHIVNVHTGTEGGITKPDFSMEDLQLYARYAKTIKPKISPEARQYFVDNYINLRSSDSSGASRSAYRITVRQLESMIRLAEARARLDLDEFVRPQHVMEAARLLKTSIVHVENRDVSLYEDEEEDLPPMRNPNDNDDDNNDNMGGGNNNDDGGDDGHGGDNGAVANNNNQTTTGTTSNEGDAAATTASKAKKEVQLPFQMYQFISLSLVSILRRHETLENPAMSWSELCQRYLEEREKEGDFESTEEVIQHNKLVELVILRLIKVDHILLLVKTSKDKTKRMLRVHPNFNGEDTSSTNNLQAEDELPPEAIQQQQEHDEAKALVAAVTSAQPIVDPTTPVAHSNVTDILQASTSASENDTENAHQMTDVPDGGAEEAQTPSRSSARKRKASSPASASKK